ncbi:peptidylprolyl isomerase [Romboutsia weinsteinii]|uniref:Peptidylprolyl isomerase n=1 Tax=Romboutsia weinsteinii TaxID=2020949 RepID=A0A371J2J5_9FIRM|nr:peptidylprolyl isomerase [Romboutsia weinsteinii]RDY26913.1 peptidylprolyl isomerase [Romboutsia weinsteinii]
MSEDNNLRDDKKVEDQEPAVEIEQKETTEEVTQSAEPMDKANDDNVEAKETKKKGINKNIKTAIIAGVVGVLCLGGGYMLGKDAGRGLPATAKNYSSSKVLATVGDVKITGEQMQKKMDPLFYSKGNTVMTEEEIAAYESSFIDYMTTTEVLYKAASENKVEVKDEDVDSEYKNLMSSITSKYQMSEEEFLKQFSLTPDYIKAELKKELAAAEYISKESDVTDKEAQNYYDKNKDEFLQVKASHILIKNVDEEGNALDDEQKEANRVKAEEILEKAKSGVDFAELAKEYSEDASAEDGGNLDFFGKGQMVEAFENAAFALKSGEISDKLVETNYGYHIIKKTDEKTDDFDTVKEELKSTLSYEKQSKILDDLTEKYGVKVNK